MKTISLKMILLLAAVATLFSLTACDKEGDEGVSSERNLLTDGNPPIPIADIEPVTAICPVAPPIKVSYDGSKSFDTDGKIVSYEWFVNLDGSDTLLSTNVSGEIPDLCALVGNREGKYEVGLTVEDNDGNRVTYTETIEIKVLRTERREVEPVASASNKPPVAKAGNDRTVTVNASVHMDGSASSDPDGSIVKYQWKEGNTVLSTQKAFDYTPTSTGDHILTLIVTDDDGAKGEDKVKVTATAETNNQPPQAVISQPQNNDVFMCYEGNVDAITLDGHESTDPDGDSLAFSWSGTSNGESVTGFINSRDQQVASVTLGDAGDGGLCDFVGDHCQTSSGGLGCDVIFNLNVNDGNANDTATVTVKLTYPI